jgi:hypothetical protein
MEVDHSGEISGEARPEPEPELAAAAPSAATAALEHQQPWREQLTVRGLVAAALIGSMYTVIVMKLNLTTGFVPTMNVSAALLAFLALRGWTAALARLGVRPSAARPFTRQENTVVQTCAVACYSLGLCGTCKKKKKKKKRNCHQLILRSIRLACSAMDAWTRARASLPLCDVS